MLRFKVTDRATAKALKDYWKVMYNIDVIISAQELFCELLAENVAGDNASKETKLAGTSFWREVNEAFIAGRASLSV